MTHIVTPKLVIVLGVLIASLAGGLAYAALDREFDLPIQATVKIVSPTQAADVNGDGKVDGSDLRIVARNIGIGLPGDVRADVDKNGAVNILDLAIVGRFLTE